MFFQKNRSEFLIFSLEMILFCFLIKGNNRSDLLFFFVMDNLFSKIKEKN